jgi:cytoskeletal protein CcmA (bactofilin family)
MASVESASTIGRGTLVRGSVRGEGDLEILGHVEGSVLVSGELVVGEGALVKSDVGARRVTIRGAVAGNVSATEAIVIEAGARVVGDLGAPQIGIRPGALVRGMVSTGAPLASGASPAAATAARARPAAAPARSTVARPAAPAEVGRSTPKPAVQDRAGGLRPASQAHAPRPAASPRVEAPAVSHAAEVEDADAGDGDAHEEPSRLVEHAEREQRGGPPPPVVPAIRKGAKASLRRKGAR